MAESKILTQNSFENISVISGTADFTIYEYFGYRQGNHYHVGVRGILNPSSSEATNLPFFKINGLNSLPSNKRVGNCYISNSSDIIQNVGIALAEMKNNGYVYQKLTNTISANSFVSFDLSFCV